MKNRSLILLCFLLSVCNFASSQDWVWSNSIKNSQGALLPRGIISDNVGNNYIIAAFKDTCQIGNFTLISNGHYDILMAKYNSKGEVQWAINNGGKGKETPRQIILDNSNNLFLVGSITDTAIFNSTDPGISDTLINKNPYRTSFVAKYSSDGNLIWTKIIGDAKGDNFLSGVGIDNENNLIVCGQFSDTSYFESDTLISMGGRDFFYAKLDEFANVEWVKQVKGAGANTIYSALIGGVSVLSNNSYAFSGFFYDTLYINNDTLITKGICDIILFNTDSEGNVNWVRQAGSSNYDRCNGMTSDAKGNIYLTGYVSDSATFESAFENFSEPLYSHGGFDFMYAKYTHDGTLEWCKSNGGAGWDIGYDIFVKDSLVYLSGYTSGSSVWGVDSINTLSSVNADPTLVIASTRDGNPKSAKHIKGKNELDKFLNLNVDVFNNINLLGEFQSDTIFINDNIITKNINSKSNGFITKYGYDVSCYLPSIKDKQCDSISIPFTIDIPEQISISSIDCEFKGFSEKLTFISITSESTLSGENDWAFSVNETDSSIKIASAGAQDVTESGILFYLNFAIPFVKPDTVRIEISDVQFNEYTFDINTIDGSVIIDSISVVVGDVSLNGDVSSFDASLVLKEIVDLTDLQCSQLANADYSGDYTISSLDAYYILQEASGISPDIPESNEAVNSLQSTSIIMEDASITQNQTFDLEVEIDQVNNLNAFYQEIDYDNNVLELNSISWKSDQNDMSIASKDENGKLKIAAASLKSSNSVGDISSTLNFTVKPGVNADSTSVRLSELRVNELPTLVNAGKAVITFGASDINSINTYSNNKISNNYPNPFTESTTIKLILNKEQSVILRIYDINGQLINTLINHKLPSGSHSIVWNCDSNNGNTVAPGQYFYELITKNKVETGRMLKLN